MTGRRASSATPPALDGLAGLLGLGPGSVLAVAGAGGKTSVINLLAREAVAANPITKVLILPAAKILPPTPDDLGGLPVTLRTTLSSCLAHRPQPGVQCLGILDQATGKLAAPPPEHWTQLAQAYGLTLMEVDGSAGLPCKGWRGDEPVVVPFATLTLGIVSLAGLGRPADDTTVLRLPRFCALTGLAPGQPIALEALAAMAGAPGGMFKGSSGARALLINQIEDPNQLESAKLLARLVQKRYPDTIDFFIAGSAHKNSWHRLD